MIHYVKAFVSASHDGMRFQRVVLKDIYNTDLYNLIISRDFRLHKCNYTVFSRFRFLHNALLGSVSDYASVFGQKIHNAPLCK